MRLYSLTGAEAVSDPEFGHFTPVEDGGFDFPDALSARLHHIGVGGRRQWEDHIERQHRLIAEEAARRADPATLLGAVEQILAAAQAAQLPAAASAGAAKPSARRKAQA